MQSEERQKELLCIMNTVVNAFMDAPKGALAVDVLQEIVSALTSSGYTGDNSVDTDDLCTALEQLS